MKKGSKSLQSLLENLPRDPVYTREQHQALPRLERIMMHVLHPRYYWLEDADVQYLELMKQAYSVLVSNSEDDACERLIRELIPSEYVGGPGNTFAVTREVIRDTKEFFGKILIRDKDFDREVLRRRLWQLAERAREKGEMDVERMCLKELAKLEDLNKRDRKTDAPVIPEIPKLELTTDPAALDIEDAVIEASHDGVEDLG